MRARAADEILGGGVLLLAVRDGDRRVQVDGQPGRDIRVGASGTGRLPHRGAARTVRIRSRCAASAHRPPRGRLAGHLIEQLP